MAGMKALLIHTGLVTPDTSGDYPPDAAGRRPHVDELWDIFMAKASTRKTAHLLADLGGASQLRIFQTWRSTHRYASDGSIPGTVVTPRLAFLKRLRGVVSQEIP